MQDRDFLQSLHRSGGEDAEEGGISGKRLVQPCGRRYMEKARAMTTHFLSVLICQMAHYSQGTAMIEFITVLEEFKSEVRAQICMTE